MLESNLRRTWVEIDLDALAHNYTVLRNHMGTHSRLVGVVKADAYGHGAVQVGKMLEELGAGYLAVSDINEARELRHAGICLPILQLGMTPADQTLLMITNNITQTVHSEAAAREFSDAALKTGHRLRVHIKVDTGMSRLGFQCDETHFEESLEALCRVCTLPGLKVEGIFTHFAVADDRTAESEAYTHLQHNRFMRLIDKLEEREIRIPLHHCANSGATADYPQYAHDLFRPGILTYGVCDQETSLDLHPVMTLKTTVGVIKEYNEDVTISYGRTFRTERPSRVGVLPIGYADGFMRALSGKWSVWTPHGLAPVIGRICMDMCMIDLTDLPDVRVGDEVEVYGAHNSVADAAHLAGTVAYELMCAVSKRVPRAYYRNGTMIYRELLLRG